MEKTAITFKEINTRNGEMEGQDHQLHLPSLHGPEKDGVAGAGGDLRGAVCEQACWSRRSCWIGYAAGHAHPELSPDLLARI